MHLHFCKTQRGGKCSIPSRIYASGNPAQVGVTELAQLARSPLGSPQVQINESDQAVFVRHSADMLGQFQVSDREKVGVLGFFASLKDEVVESV